MSAPLTLTLPLPLTTLAPVGSDRCRARPPPGSAAARRRSAPRRPAVPAPAGANASRGKADAERRPSRRCRPALPRGRLARRRDGLGDGDAEAERAAEDESMRMLVHDGAAVDSELLADENIEPDLAVVALRRDAAARRDEALDEQAAAAAVGHAEAVRDEPADVVDIGQQRVLVLAGDAVVAEQRERPGRRAAPRSAICLRYSQRRDQPRCRSATRATDSRARRTGRPC